MNLFTPRIAFFQLKKFNSCLSAFDKKKSHNNLPKQHLSAHQSKPRISLVATTALRLLKDQIDEQHQQIVVENLTEGARVSKLHASDIDIKCVRICRFVSECVCVYVLLTRMYVIKLSSSRSTALYLSYRRRSTQRLWVSVG